MTPLHASLIPALVLAAQPPAPGGESHGGEFRSEQSNAGVSLVYRVSPVDLTVAQRIRVELTLTAPAGWSVSWPAVGEKLGRSSVVDTSDARDGSRHTRTFTLEPYLPGDDTVPALSVSASPRDPGAQAAPVTLTTEPVQLSIRALLPEAEGPDAPLAPELRDAHLGADAGRGVPAWLIGVGAGCLTVFVATGVIAATRRRAAPADPAAAALARLDAVAAAPEPASTADRNAALDAISHATREFIQARGVANAVGMTTRDLISAVAMSASLGPVAARMSEQLASVDAARFDPRHGHAAPGPIAAQIAVVLRSTLPPQGAPPARGQSSKGGVSA